MKPPWPDNMWLLPEHIHGHIVSSTVVRFKIMPKRGVFGWGVVELPPLPLFGYRQDMSSREC
jgi:hypothetical protein